MIDQAPREARWVRAEPRRTLPEYLVDRIVQTAFPRSRAVGIQPLTEGWRNANFKLHVEGKAEPIVLRIYEHDASICQKEVDLMRFVRGSVPVPEVIHVEARGWDDIPPFVLMRCVDGISLRDLKKSGDPSAMAQAAASAGEILAAIGRKTFSKPGWLAPGPSVTCPLLEGKDPIPRYIDLCLESAHLQPRLPAELRERAHSLIWSWAPQIADLDGARCLVHGDYGKRNLLVRNVEGRWVVVGVLDWEFAVSGSPLADIGHFLRYERNSRPLMEPYFSEAYLRAGGTLPKNWRQLARLIDFTNICASLTYEDLFDEVVVELAGLVAATIENRDPP
jgi:aminoglycoside phosphotransferase (APT) family kinase protein